MALREVTYETVAEIRNDEFRARVPLYFSLITSDETYWPESVDKLAMKAIQVHILKKVSKEIRAQLDAERDLPDYDLN